MASWSARSGCAIPTTGLFALAGRHSEAGRLAAAGKHDLAAQWLADWQRHTGERLHLELTRTQRDGEDAFNAFALQASRDRGIPVIASNDVRFLDASGFDAHEARVCISTGRVLDDPKRPRDYSAEQYLKSSDEMAALFADVPDAIDNTVALATRCNLELSLGTYFLPAFPVPSGRHAGELDPQPVARRPGASAWPSIRRRRNTARDALRARGWRSSSTSSCQMGFPGYFLIVADFINWAQGQRRAGRARAAARARARWWRMRSASPTSIRCATTCCSSAS